MHWLIRSFGSGPLLQPPWPPLALSGENPNTLPESTTVERMPIPNVSPEANPDGR